MSIGYFIIGIFVGVTALLALAPYLLALMCRTGFVLRYVTWLDTTISRRAK